VLVVVAAFTRALSEGGDRMEGNQSDESATEAVRKLILPPDAGEDSSGEKASAVSRESPECAGVLLVQKRS
jgi:hypothetical protein